MVQEIEIEIVNIKDEGHRFVVEYEVVDTRERVTHGFPKGNGWMDKTPNGEYKFMRELRKMIAKKNECILEKIDDCINEIKGRKEKVTINDLNN